MWCSPPEAEAFKIDPGLRISTLHQSHLQDYGIRLILRVRSELLLMA
jgi:hypothetical protein